jgi:hypothetical protein
MQENETEWILNFNDKRLFNCKSIVFKNEPIESIKKLLNFEKNSDFSCRIPTFIDDKDITTDWSFFVQEDYDDFFAKISETKITSFNFKLKKDLKYYVDTYANVNAFSKIFQSLLFQMYPSYSQLSLNEKFVPQIVATNIPEIQNIQMVLQIFPLPLPCGLT